MHQNLNNARKMFRKFSAILISCDIKVGPYLRILKWYSILKKFVLSQKHSNKAKIWICGRKRLKLHKNNFFKIWAGLCSDISHETAKLRKNNTPKVYGPFSKAGTMIFLTLTDVVDNASKFTLVGYEEDWCVTSTRFWCIFEKSSI